LHLAVQIRQWQLAVARERAEELVVRRQLAVQLVAGIFVDHRRREEHRLDARGLSLIEERRS
jgi:hypothetical protein